MSKLGRSFSGKELKMAEVLLENINKSFGKIIAVDDFSLEILDKEFIVFVGPSGCGKSTTLRMIAGLEDISSGNISIDKAVVNNTHPKNRDIAMVFQNYALYPHLSVRENISFGIRAQKLPKKEIIARTNEAAEILGLEDLLDRRPGELSGGQKQRVAMGRAIVRKPKVFLFDEPLSNLDAKLRHKMRAEMKKLHQKVRTTTIYVTHDQVEAMTLADRIVIMKDGKIEQVGSPDEVYHKPKSQFVASFIGSPAMNFISGVYESDKNNKKLRINNEQTIDLIDCAAMNGSKLTLGIRPEHMSLKPKQKKTPNKSFIEAKISVLEPMGHEIIVTCDSSAGEIIGKYTGKEKLEVGQDIIFELNKESIHFFNENGELVE